MAISPSKNKRETIVLVDIFDFGHHRSWFVVLAHKLVGYCDRLLLLYPRPEKIRLSLKERMATEDFKKIRLSMALTDFRSVFQVLKKTMPDEIYNLAGQTSVGLSFEQPVETLESIALGTLNLLETIRILDVPIRFYNASSSECFGDTEGEKASEKTPFHPRSPYAVAKAAAFWEVANYREAYRLFACSGILFNHESPLRPERFVTRKIVRAACRIAKGSNEVLELGNMEIRRDWGWAPEYVDGIRRVLQHTTADDFLFATGATRSLKDFVSVAFNEVNLEWKEHVRENPELLRASEIMFSGGDASKAEQVLGWKAKVLMEDVVKKMMLAEMEGSKFVNRSM